jgi:CRP-like cAMP-binding protein
MGEQIPYAPLPETPAGALTTLQKAEFLRGVEVFSQTTVEELCGLASIAREVGYTAERIIFREEDFGDAFYIVVRGRVELTSRASGGRAVAGPGQAVGLYSVLTREPHCATAKALENTLGICVGAEDLYSLLSNNMEIVAGMFRYFRRKLGLALQT